MQGLHSVAPAAWAGGAHAPPSSAASLPAPVPPMHMQMIPAGQYILWAHWCSVQMLHAAAAPAMQPIPWPHRSVLPTGGIGPVLPDFSPQPHGKPRGSLRTDLAVYDIIFFIALGLSMEVRCCCDASSAPRACRGHAGIHAQLPLPLACWLGTSMPPAAHPTRAASLRLFPLPPRHNAVTQNPAGLARVSVGGQCARLVPACANTEWSDHGVRRSCTSMKHSCSPSPPPIHNCFHPPSWRSRERICWPPTNYSPDAQRRYVEQFCASLPEPQRRRARAQQQRIQLMQRWIAGWTTVQQAAEEERRIQQGLDQAEG